MDGLWIKLIISVKEILTFNLDWFLRWILEINFGNTS